jgi:hypothetical protein
MKNASGSSVIGLRPIAGHGVPALRSGAAKEIAHGQDSAKLGIGQGKLEGAESR